jgi:hypothetical protein
MPIKQCVSILPSCSIATRYKLERLFKRSWTMSDKEKQEVLNALNMEKEDD